MFGDASSASSVSREPLRQCRGRERCLGRGIQRLRGRFHDEVVQRAVVDERRDGHVGDELVADEDAQRARVGDGPDRGPADLPLRADLEHVVERLGRADAEHPLLRLADHDLPGRHAGLAQRHARDVDVEPDLALGGHLGRRRRQPRRAEVLQRHEQPALEQLQRALQHLLLGERVADLDGRALVGVALAELGRGEHRGAADPVAAGRGAEQDERVADAGRRAADQPVGARQPERHRVDEAVLLVGLLEVELAADRRHADRVAVVADPADRVVEQVARARRGRLAEAQRIEHGDRPRADREDVAQDPADAGRGALERLDRRRVVVRLDLEGDHPAVADVDRARVLARAEREPRALGRQRAKQLLGVLVGAVLAPHQREDRELDLVGLATELLADQRELGRRQPQRDGLLNCGHGPSR